MMGTRPQVQSDGGSLLHGRIQCRLRNGLRSSKRKPFPCKSPQLRPWTSREPDGVLGALALNPHWREAEASIARWTSKVPGGFLAATLRMAKTPLKRGVCLNAQRHGAGGEVLRIAINPKPCFPFCRVGLAYRDHAQIGNRECRYFVKTGCRSEPLILLDRPGSGGILSPFETSIHGSPPKWVFLFMPTIK